MKTNKLIIKATKKILFSNFIIFMIFISCNKNEIENIFNETAEQRNLKLIETTKKDLIDNKDGWLTTYIFDNQKEVIVLKINFYEGDSSKIEVISVNSDIVITTPEMIKTTSTYTLRFSQQIDLIFDTYSLFSHLVEKGKQADFRWQLEEHKDGIYNFVSRTASDQGISYLELEKFTDKNKETALKSFEVLNALSTATSQDFYFRTLDVSIGTNTDKYNYSYVGGKMSFIKQNFKLETGISVKGNIITLDSSLVIEEKEIKEFEYNESDGSIKIINVDGVTGSIGFLNAPALGWASEDATEAIKSSGQIDFRPYLDNAFQNSNTLAQNTTGGVINALETLGDKGMKIDRITTQRNGSISIRIADYNIGKYVNYVYNIREEIKDNKIYFTEIDKNNRQHPDASVSIILEPLAQMFLNPKGLYIELIYPKYSNAHYYNFIGIDDATGHNYAFYMLIFI